MLPKVSNQHGGSTENLRHNVSVAKWANMLSEPQYLLGLSGWRPAEARDQIQVAAGVVGQLD